MSLIICRECHAEISSDAKVCPHCGKKLELGCFSIVLIMIGVFFIVAVIATVVGSFQNPNGVKQIESNDDLKTDAYVRSKEVIKIVLKAPSTSDFASYNESTIIQEGDYFTIKSYVDAQNSFSAKLRMYFVVELSHINNEWHFIRYKTSDIGFSDER